MLWAVDMHSSLRSTLLGFMLLLAVVPCRADFLEELAGDWSVTSSYSSAPDAPGGGTSGSSSYHAVARLLPSGTLRITSTDQPITRSLFGLFSSDVRIILDLQRNGGIKGSTRINNAVVQTVKGTWRQHAGVLEATLYSSSRGGKRVTSLATVERSNADTLVVAEERSDGLTATVIANRVR